MFLLPYLTSYSLILISLLIILIFHYTTRNFNYWKNKNVPYIRPSIFFGNFFDIFLFKTTVGELLTKFYNEMDEPFFGIFVFDIPHLIVKEPDLIKNIIINDFSNFIDRNIVSSSNDPITQHMLFVEKGIEWKKIRAKLSPVFSSGKIKAMIPHINKVGEDMQLYLEKNCQKSSIEAKEICAKFSTDVIAKCAFAINAHSFDDENADFRKIGRMMFDFNLSNAIQQTAYFFSPRLVKLFKMNFIDPKASSFLRYAFWNAIKSRQNSKILGNDVIDTIVDLLNNKEFCNEFNFEGDKAVCQAVQFFAAGFETTSSAIAFTLYELSLHPEMQDKLRNEIRLSLDQNDGKFTYESIQDMKYLHMCVCETLRKYPALPFLDRKCKEAYKIPGSDITLEKDTPIFIPIFSLHYDDKYFPNPNEYNPERFSTENISKVSSFAYLPFGKGPRACIGERFGLVSTKIGIVSVLKEFYVEKASNTPVPIKFEPKTFLVASQGGIPIKFRKIQSSF